MRNRILANFELAAQVHTSEEERRRLLHFVVVGGGPTGVEFSAEFYDFFQQVSVGTFCLEQLPMLATSYSCFLLLFKIQWNASNLATFGPVIVS